MVQTALDLLHGALRALFSLALPLGLSLGAALLALLVIGLLDRERLRSALPLLAARLPAVAGWGLAALALGTGTLLLRISRQAVDLRLGTQQSARYANAADPDGGQTVQSAPRASLVQTTTYTRSLTLPRDIYTRITVQGGWENLLPYLGSPPGPSIQALTEGFVRRGNSLVYSREVALQSEVPVNLDASRVSTDLKFVDPAGGRGSYYNAAFAADYTFSNPTPAPATMRFAFPLPTGSGTLSNFRLSVNGREFRASDLVGGSVWQGEVPGRGVVRVNVTYRNQGARSWSYQLGQRREAIKFFKLSITTDRPAKFQRYTLFPTRQTRSALSGQHTLSWQLQDVITAQDVAVVFAQGSLRETLAKVGAIKPAALALAALLCVAWAWARRGAARPPILRPLPLAAGLLGLSVGFTLGGVLSAYLSVPLAETLGALAGLGLALLALGRRLWLPLALGAAVPLVFLSGGHAGLLLSGLAALILALLRPGTGTATRSTPGAPAEPLG